MDPSALRCPLSGEVATKAEAVELVRTTWERAQAWSKQTGRPVGAEPGLRATEEVGLTFHRPRLQDRRAHKLALELLAGPWCACGLLREGMHSCGL